LLPSFQSSSINPFSPISPLIPSVQVSLGLPRFLLPMQSYQKIGTSYLMFLYFVFGSLFIYLAVCTTFSHFPAPI
jgi:hypothetical protein